MKAIRDHLARSRNEDGITLVEVLIAMLIFAIISTSVIYTMLSVLSVGRDSRARQVAANLAAGEIDLARDTENLFDLVSFVRSPNPVLNGDTFHVTVGAQWVTDPDLDFTCGGTAGGAGAPLRYKRVNVTVTWDNMRASTDAVRADTVIDPKERINDPTKGTILVSVLNGSGTGNAAVNVTTVPSTGFVISPTDSQGCTYILKVPPGSYDVTASKSGFIDGDQNASATSHVTVLAGASVSVGFQYDLAATYTAHLATNYTALPGTVKFPTDLKTSFWNTYGIYHRAPTTGVGTVTQTFKLHPYAAGYQAYAGECDAADPGEWPAEQISGVNWAGVRGAAVATTPGGAAGIDVPMGIVTIAGGGTGNFVKAVSQAPVSGFPGCASTVTYTFGSILGAAPTTVALPYGTWALHRSSSAGTAPTLANQIGQASLSLPVLAVLERSAISSTGIITFDPRVVVP